MTIRPLSASEKLLAGPPYRGCGISSDLLCQMLATGNEAGRDKWLREVGSPAMRKTMQRGWDAFSQQIPPDSNGWVDQGDIQLIRRAMWGKDCEQPFIGRIPLAEVWDAIGDYAVSAAIDTGAVPATDAIRRYVGPVAHQVVWWRKRTRKGRRQVFHYCPMVPPKKAYTGHWVEWPSAVKCAKAIKDSDGEAFVALYPVGDWTAEALRVAALTRNTIRPMRAENTALGASVKRLRAEKAALQAELDAITPQDPANARAAGWEAFGNEAIDRLTALLNEGPPA